MQKTTKTLTVEELNELLAEMTQRDCGVWPEPENPQPEKEDDANGQ